MDNWERDRGFTLVEVMIALVIVAIIFGVAAATIVTGQNALGGSSLQGELQDRARNCMNRIADELMSSGPSCPGWEIPLSGTVLAKYRKCMGYDPETAEVLWDPPFPGAEPKQLVLDDDDPEVSDNKRLIVVDANAGAKEPVQGNITVLTIVADPDETGDNRKVRITLELTDRDIRGKRGGPTDRVILRTRDIFLRN